MDKQLEELSKKLKQFPHDLQDRVIVFATRKAALKLKKEVKANAPVQSGFLRQSIGISKIRERDSKVGNIEYFVGIRRRVKSKLAPVRNGGPLATAFYGAFLEEGTKKMRKRPFMAPALNASADELLAEFKKGFKAKFEREIGI